MSEPTTGADKTDRSDAGRANRLAGETSPYLQQHAHNPVDWYPWGPEALTASRDLDRPIFLSIGYSACHWCHVMEHESFEDPSIADLMNRFFINIKVDREERPDLDQIYMHAVTALTGRGGWPMSVFLTPKLQPFYGGTYWPPESRMGMPGFRDILERVRDAWLNQRDELERAAGELSDAVVAMGKPGTSSESVREDLSVESLKQAESARLRMADRVHGGFGGAPKFPHPMDLRLLLRTWKRFGTADALEVVKLTLDKMSAGGIYDHLGGGFHRYSTDGRWLVPHFEKMLYDNALLTSALVEVFQATREPRYERVARETLDYVLREMTHPEGGFYSTQDADSEGEEGKFFVWTVDEINAVLEPEQSRIFCYCYDVTPQGNWEGKNILNRVKTHAQAARLLGMGEPELDALLLACRQKLLARREERIDPGRDEKIIAGWNGLMIAAMAQAGAALGETRYVAGAARAADFVLTRMRTESTGLLHVFKDGRIGTRAFLDDMACLADALVDVYQATFDARYAEAALALAEELVEQFSDEDEGGFFYTRHDHEPLIARNKDLHDNATPSGSGMAAFALARLSRLSGRQDLEDRARRTLELLSGEIARGTMAVGQSLLALDDLLGPSYEMVQVNGESAEENAQALRAVRDVFVPNKIVARRPAGSTESATPRVLRPLLGGKTADGGKATLYVCERGACRPPVAGVREIGELLQTL